jgi:hypothetical protein
MEPHENHNNTMNHKKTITSKVKRWAVNIAVLACTLIIAVFMMEFALRFTQYRYLTGYINLHETRYYVEASDDAGHDISRNHPRRTINIEPGYTQEIWSNELACYDAPYRGENPYVLLLGDSFTFGLVPFETTWGNGLNNIFDVRVLKCGVCGYGPQQELIKARKTISLIKRNPQLIIVGYCIGNDLADDYAFPNGTVIDGYPVLRNLIDYRSGNIIHRTSDELKRSLEK